MVRLWSAIAPVVGIPVDEIAQSKHLALLLTESGGHVGFIDTLFGRGATYMDRLFIQYVNAVFSHQETLAAI